MAEGYNYDKEDIFKSYFQFEEDTETKSSSDSESSNDIESEVSKLPFEIIQKDEAYNNRVIKIKGFINSRNVKNFENNMTTIIDCDVSCIAGKTGCGKSTIIPLGIYAANDTKKIVNRVIVLEPTRVSTTSLCTYLCNIIKEKVGESFGFKTSGHSSCSKKTSLIVMTYGYFLMIISDEHYLDTIDYIILDEVHILDSTIQTLLVILQLLKKENRLKAKIIFMSATIEKKLEKYIYEKFGKPNRIEIERAKELLYKVSTITMQQISTYSSFTYLKNHLSNAIPILNKKQIHPKIQLSAAVTIVQHILDHMGVKDKINEGRGGILIFVHGEGVMNVLLNSLQHLEQTYHIHIECLTSKVSYSNQMRIVQNRNWKDRQIILSTPMCESSLTIPFIDYVIDTCIVNSLNVDISSDMWELKPRFITHTEAYQRQGRVGRVHSGSWFGLIGNFRDHLQADSTDADLFGPDIMQTFLLFHKFNIKSPQDKLNQSPFELCVYGPAESSITNGIGLMKSQGLLSPWVNSSTFSSLNGDVTLLGELVTDLPINKCYGKLIIMGLLLNELDACSALAAILSRGDLADHMLHRVRKSNLSSDFVSLLYSFEDFVKRDKKNDALGERWALEFDVNVDSMHYVERTVELIRLRLQQFGFEGLTPCSSYNVELDCQMLFNRTDLLRACVAGGLYPYYYVTRTNLGSTTINSVSALRRNTHFRPTTNTMLDRDRLPPNRQVIAATCFGKVNNGEIILRQLELLPDDTDYIGLYSLLFCKYGTVSIDDDDICQYGHFGLGNIIDPSTRHGLNYLFVGHDLHDFSWSFTVEIRKEDILQFNHLRELLSKAILPTNRQYWKSYQKHIFGSLVILMMTHRLDKFPMEKFEKEVFGSTLMSSALEVTFPPLTVTKVSTQ